MGETRKLAAILVSDVVGYSRLTGADEDRILARLRALRSWGWIRIPGDTPTVVDPKADRFAPGRERAPTGLAGALPAKSSLRLRTSTRRTADRFDSISANKEISTLCDRLFCLHGEWEVLLCHCAVIRQ